MILFIWSLVASAVDYVNRYRLAQFLNMHLSKTGSLLLRRIATSAENAFSVPQQRQTRSISTPSVSTSNFANPNTNNNTVVYRRDKVEILYNEDPTQIDFNRWHCFDPLPSKLARSITSSHVVYFISKLSPCDGNTADKYPIEDKCIPVAWRTEDVALQVLFACLQSQFATLACDWSENLILYRNFFDVIEIETVTILPADLEKLNIFRAYRTNNVLVNVRRPSSLQSPTGGNERGGLLKGLEQLCLSDILSAKELCKSIGQFSQEDDGSGVSNGGSNNDRRKSPACDSWTISPNQDKESPIVQQQPLTTAVSLASPKLDVSTRASTSMGTNLSPVTEVLTPRSDTEPEAVLSVSAPDEPRYRRRSPYPEGFKDRSFENPLQKIQLNRRSCSLGSVYFTNEEDITTRRYKSQSRKSLSGSSYNKYDTINNRRRWSLSLSTPVLNDTTGQSKFRRLSTLRTLGHSGVITGKPPNVLVYCGNSGSEQQADETFDRLRDCLRNCLNLTSRYVVYRLKHDKFLADADTWIRNAACLIIADLSSLDEKHWQKMYEYFRLGGRILFVCENGLIANLRDCHSAKKRYGLLKLAFENNTNSGGVGNAMTNHLNNFLRSKSSNSSANKDFEKFLKKLSQKFDNSSICEQTIVNDSGNVRFTLSIVKEANSPLIFYMQNSHQRAGALFSDITLQDFLNGAANGLLKQIFERLHMDTKVEPSPQLSPGYLCFENETYASMDVQRSLLSRSFVEGRIKLVFQPYADTGESAKPTESTLPVHFTAANDQYPNAFDRANYFANLYTEVLGRSVLYVENCTSTIPICESLIRAFPDDNSFITIAKRQINAKGRTTNQWVSPAGCAAFTFCYNSTAKSTVSSYAGYLQHIVALAVVDGICSLDGFETFDLHIKWPNDVYYGRNVKIGGILVTCNVRGDNFQFSISCGLNVANSTPTLCLNDLLPSDMEPFTCERVIALIVTRFEQLIRRFEMEGHDAILPMYYKYWLHDYQELTLTDKKEQVIVRGLDKHGYLQVRSRQNGKLISLQPDGNSLDMMQNLIRIKN